MNKSKKINKKYCKVHLLHEHHPCIRAEDWRSPLVRRLIKTDKYSDGDCAFENSYRSKNDKTIENGIVLTWIGLRDDFIKCIKTYQAPNITEYATLGLACILVTKNTELEITEVTRRGDRADYWIGDKDLLIEISGHQDGKLGDLCDEKAKQLLDNPFNKSGFVCVAIYNDHKARLWYFSRNEKKK